jgi:hypothetical protein
LSVYSRRQVTLMLLLLQEIEQFLQINAKEKDQVSTDFKHVFVASYNFNR